MFSIIVGIDKNNLIGKDGKLPWDFKEDLQYFKTTTLNKKIAMGYNTFISIGRPLPNRENIVFSREKAEIPGVIVYNDIDKFVEEYKDSKEEIFIIGGSFIYNYFLDLADKLYITHIKHEYEGDTYFPEIDYSLYNEKKIKENEDLIFKVYEKKAEI